MVLVGIGWLLLLITFCDYARSDMVFQEDPDDRVRKIGGVKLSSPRLRKPYQHNIPTEFRTFRTLSPTNTKNQKLSRDSELLRPTLLSPQYASQSLLNSKGFQIPKGTTNSIIDNTKHGGSTGPCADEHYQPVTDIDLKELLECMPKRKHLDLSKTELEDKSPKFFEDATENNHQTKSEKKDAKKDSLDTTNKPKTNQFIIEPDDDDEEDNEESNKENNLHIDLHSPTQNVNVEVKNTSMEFISTHSDTDKGSKGTKGEKPKPNLKNHKDHGHHHASDTKDGKYNTTATATDHTKIDPKSTVSANNNKNEEVTKPQKAPPPQNSHPPKLTNWPGIYQSFPQPPTGQGNPYFSSPMYTPPGYEGTNQINWNLKYPTPWDSNDFNYNMDDNSKCTYYKVFNHNISKETDRDKIWKSFKATEIKITKEHKDTAQMCQNDPTIKIPNEMFKVQQDPVSEYVQDQRYPQSSMINRYNTENTFTPDPSSAGLVNYYGSEIDNSQGLNAYYTNQNSLAMDPYVRSI